MLPALKSSVVAALMTGSLVSAASAEDASYSFSGQYDFGFRNFVDDGLYVGQSSAGAQVFSGLKIDANFGIGNGNLVLSLDGILDQEGYRNHYNIGELNFNQSFDNWSYLVGYHTENWGVAESHSIVNVLNPTDNASPTMGGDLLGTPMINVNFNTGVGTFSAYALLGFIESNLGDGTSARFRSPILTNSERAYFEEGNGRKADFALRYSNNLSIGEGSLDFAVSYFNGTSRDPLRLPGCANPYGPTITETVCNTTNDSIISAYESGSVGGTADVDAFWAFLEANMTDLMATTVSAIPSVGFIPYYQKVQQVGLTAVYAVKDVQLRFEGVYRDTGRGDSFAAVVGGDYTFSGLGGGAGDLTVAMEYLYAETDAAQLASIFEDDIFLGLNYRFNDQRDTSVTFGVFHDISSQARLFNIGASTRLTDSVRAEINASHVTVTGWNDPLAFIKNDTFIELKLSAFF